MTWPATLPGAAVRVLRIAAGRRALRLVLVAGGLLAIGFLCGERAYAADGGSVGASSVGASSVSSASAAVSDSGAVPDGLRSATEQAVERLLSTPAAPGASAASVASDKPGAHDEKPQHPAPPIPAPLDQAPQAQAPLDRVPLGQQADDEGSQVQSPNPQSPNPWPPRPRPPHPQTDTPQPSHDHILSPVTEPVGQVVGAQVVRPVGDVVRTVTEDLAVGLAEVQAKVPPLALLPTAPESPAWPSWPGWELPALPGLPELPGAGVPVLPGQTLPAPVTGTPQPGSDAPGSGDGRAVKGRTGKEATGAYGPRFVADGNESHSPVAGDGHRAAPSGYAPAHQAPADHPGGVQGNHAVGDSGTPRHGDAQAVSLSRRVALGLVPGSAARVEVDAIQDRHRDIPVSPA